VPVRGLGTVVVEGDHLSVKSHFDLSHFHIIGDDFDGAGWWNDCGIHSTVNFHFATEYSVENFVDGVPIVHVKRLQKEKKKKFRLKRCCFDALIVSSKSSLAITKIFQKRNFVQKHRKLRDKNFLDFKILGRNGHLVFAQFDKNVENERDANGMRTGERDANGRTGERDAN